MLTRKHILDIIAKSNIAWRIDEYNLTNKTISILKKTNLLSLAGRETVVFKRGKLVYGLNDSTSVYKLILAEMESNKHIPPIEILDQTYEYYLYRMPCYEIIYEDELGDKEPIVAQIKNYAKGRVDHSELAVTVTTIRDTIRQWGYRPIWDVIAENIGWVGDTPVLFDIFRVMRT